MSALMSFTEHLVWSGFSYAYGISTVDFTGNGALDLVTADKNVGLYWFENDGKGNFTRHVIHQKTDEFLERHAIVDINGDGKPEIVIVDNINGSLLWFEFDGDPRETRSWRHHYITEGQLPGAYDVAVADFDGDGDLDVAASSWIRGNRFDWYENRNGQWIQHRIDEDNVAETRTICTADFNGNGRPDLLGAARASGQVLWYENTGDPVQLGWKKHVIDTPFSPTHGHPADMDGDGDQDVVMALGMMMSQNPADYQRHQIVWYENDGHPEQGPWRKHVICESFPNAFEAIAADLDGDGQMEVLASAWEANGRLALFKHRGDPRGHWDMQMLKENWIRANSVIVADLDNDGRLDIIASAEIGSNEVRWWRNEGVAGR